MWFGFVPKIVWWRANSAREAALTIVFRVPSLALKVQAKKWNLGFIFKVGGKPKWCIKIINCEYQVTIWGIVVDTGGKEGNECPEWSGFFNFEATTLSGRLKIKECFTQHSSASRNRFHFYPCFIGKHVGKGAYTPVKRPFIVKGMQYSL